MNLLTFLISTVVLQTQGGKLPFPVLPAAQPKGAAVKLAVRPQSEVAGAAITVADIAEVSGSDKPLVAQVSAVEVGTSPLIGLSRTLLKADIITRLRFNHIDLERIEIVSPPSIAVTRIGADVPVPEVVEFATKTLNTARKNASDGAQIEAIPIPYKWVVPPGKREMLAGPIRGALDGSLVTVPVTVLVDGKPAKTVEVSFKIKRMTPVLVATRQLEPHALLKADDISLTMQEVAQGSVILSDAAQVIGMRTTRQIAAGAVLTKGCVEGTPVVLIGAPVTVLVQIGSISVETSGVARSQAAVGERVRVFIAKTSKEINAVVVDAKTVRVEENG